MCEFLRLSQSISTPRVFPWTVGWLGVCPRPSGDIAYKSEAETVKCLEHEKMEEE